MSAYRVPLHIRVNRPLAEEYHGLHAGQAIYPES